MDCWQGAIATHSGILSRLRRLNVLPLTLESFHQALDLCVIGNITRQNYFDRQLAARMLREGISVILTENAKDFFGIEGITAIIPFA
jgi:predicted nucleic acid-binding protein